MGFVSKYIHKYRKEAVLAPLLKLFEATLELFVPLVVADIIDNGITGPSAGHSYIFISTFKLILLALTGLVASVTAQYFAAKAATGFAASVRSDLFSHILDLSYKNQDAIGSETLITRLTSDVTRLQSGVNMTLRLLLRSPFVVLGAMIMAFTVDVKGALIFLTVIPLLSVVVMTLIFLTLPLYRANQEKLDRLLLSVQESLHGARVIRAFSLEKENNAETASRNADVFKASLRAGRFSAIQNPLTLVMINIATILLIYVGAIRVDTGFISQGQVVALVNYTAQILVELVKIANMMVTLTQAIASGKRVCDILDQAPGDRAKRDHIVTDSASASENNDPYNTSFVRFENVSFKYHENSEPALSGISFDVKDGDFVGIIGSTGSGKTTLANLITGAYIPTDGKVTVNGDISIVPQKSVLFSGTVADNLRWGNASADDEQMWEALRISCAEEFIREKENGLLYEVNAGGKNFSGGQRQRLCIARAIMRHANILILDDSASALDYATEKKLREAVSRLPMTVFWISQRTASILNADKILVLDDGKLVGCGKHNELLETCEIYKEIYESQN